MVSLTFTGQIYHSLGSAQQLSYTYMLLTSGISCCWSASYHCVFIASAFLVFELCYATHSSYTSVQSRLFEIARHWQQLMRAGRQHSQLLLYNHIQQLPSIRERSSVLYLGMATEILNLPHFCIT